MALTREELDNLAAMPREELEKLLALIREALTLYRAKGCMPQSAMDDLVKAVPDKLVREIVEDLKGGRAEPGWLPPAPAKGPEEKTSGQARHIPLDSPPGLKYIDQLVDVQDVLDKRDLERRLRRL